MSYIQPTTVNKIMKMRYIYRRFEFVFFICFQYVNCFVSTNESKANHHCVMAFILSHAAIFGIESLPFVKLFKNDFVEYLGSDHNAVVYFLYAYYSSLMFLSIGVAIGLVTKYSKSFIRFSLKKAFLKNKKHLILPFLSIHETDIFEISIDNSNQIRALDFSTHFEIRLNQNNPILFFKLNPLNKLELINSYFIENQCDESECQYKDLSEFFKIAMFNHGQPINFYTLYNQWLHLKLGFPDLAYLKVNDMHSLDYNLQQMIIDFDDSYPEDFINYSLILSGVIYKLKGYKSTGIYSTKSSFDEYIINELKHPFNSEQTLDYDHIEPYPLSMLENHIPSLTFGFKLYHLKQLIQLNIGDEYIAKLLNTFSNDERNQNTFSNVLKPNISDKLDRSLTL